MPERVAMKAINPFSSMAAGANTFFAAIESDIQSGVKNADGEGQVGTTIEALATEIEALATDREAPASSAEADDAEAAAPLAPAVHELRERLAAAQQQCKKLEQRLAEKAELCGDKDSQLAGVLEEGEQLSKRQAEQERVIRELKQGLREAVAVGDNAKAELEAARQQQEDAARQLKERATSSDGAREEALAEATGRAEGLEELLQAERSALVALRAQHGTLQEEAQRLQVEHEARGACEASAADHLAELQVENSRLVAMARLREEGLSTQVGELQARSDAAQAHVSQLASSVPQATKPLLRQIAALQAQQQQMQTAWRESESSLQARIAAADSAAAAAAQRERTLRDEEAASAARQLALQAQLSRAEERGGERAVEAAATAREEERGAAAAALEKAAAAARGEQEQAARQIAASGAEVEAQRGAVAREQEAMRVLREARAQGSGSGAGSGAGFRVRVRVS